MFSVLRNFHLDFFIQISAYVKYLVSSSPHDCVIFWFYFLSALLFCCSHQLLLSHFASLSQLLFFLPLKWLVPILPWTLLPLPYLCLSQYSPLTQPLSSSTHTPAPSPEDRNRWELWQDDLSPAPGFPWRLHLLSKAGSAPVLSCDNFCKTLLLLLVPRGPRFVLWITRLPSLQSVLTITSFFFLPAHSFSMFNVHVTPFFSLLYSAFRYNWLLAFHFASQSWWFHFLHWNPCSSASLDQLLYFSR